MTSFNVSVGKDKLPFTKQVLFLLSEPVKPPRPLSLSLAQEVFYIHAHLLSLNPLRVPS